ncbi:MAG: S9 family peptidase [Colwellia sp.]|nr:S9 family peptidase [Colwellia sp.]
MVRKLLLLVLFCIMANPIFGKSWEHLFDHPKYQNVKISPDGKHLAIAMLTDGKRSMVFLDRESMAYVGGFRFPGKNEVGQYYWANNDRVVIKVNQREPWRKEPLYYGELYAVNVNGTRGEMIYGYRSIDKRSASSGGSKFKKKKRIEGWADIIDMLPEDEKNILISSTPWDSQGDRHAAVYKLNIYTGKINKKRIMGSPIPYADFLTNNKGEVKAVVGTNKSNIGEVFLRNGNQWQRVPASKIGSEFRPLTINTEGTHLYALDNSVGDYSSLIKLSLKDGSIKPVFSDENIDITNVEYSTDGNSIYALRLDNGYPEYLIMNNVHKEAQIFKSLVTTFPNQTVNITSHSDDGRYFIVMVRSDVQAGKFYMYDTIDNQLVSLFSYFPKIQESDLAVKEPFSFSASDGTLIRGYFTHAKSNKGDEISPLVILVHGGPHSRDYWSFNSEVQFLALNGYSVLQVNYRGSSGYGSKFESAGYLNWGTKIQKDINEAYHWAIDSGKAEVGKSCIMGASFGAYSAITSIINYPDTYQCAVANAGVYDLEFMYEKGDVPKLAFGESYLEKTIGKDKKTLKTMSPIYHTDKIKVPILLAHGEQDRRAPIEHFERLKSALDESKKRYEWFTVADESHGFFVPENQKKYMNHVVKFLDRHLM